MANEQELLTLEEKRKLWRDYEKSDPNKALPWSDVVAEAQVAKLKAMGYEQVWEICPDCHDLFLYRRKCTTCKGTGKITNKVCGYNEGYRVGHKSGSELKEALFLEIEKEARVGYVKWDREKVARELASIDNRPYDQLDEKIVRINQGTTQACYLRRADQLHKELTGEKE